MKKLSDIEDGILTGTIETKGGPCHHCGTITRVIRIDSMKFPSILYGEYEDYIDFWKCLIFCHDNATSLDRIGIGCGCYARGHRQIAHIEDNIRARIRSLGGSA